VVLFDIRVSTGQFVGDPIQCWHPAEFTDAYEEYTHSICWISNTYYVPIGDTIPVDIHSRQDKELTYYQWVPLILMFMALMFKLPIKYNIFINIKSPVKNVPPRLLHIRQKYLEVTDLNLTNLLCLYS
jgi:hypothetical protein